MSQCKKSWSNRIPASKGHTSLGGKWDRVLANGKVHKWAFLQHSASLQKNPNFHNPKHSDNYSGFPPRPYRVAAHHNFIFLPLHISFLGSLHPPLTSSKIMPKETKLSFFLYIKHSSVYHKNHLMAQFSLFLKNPVDNSW